jgi:hypothetical protein
MPDETRHVPMTRQQRDILDFISRERDDKAISDAADIAELVVAYDAADPPGTVMDELARETQALGLYDPPGTVEWITDNTRYPYGIDLRPTSPECSAQGCRLARIEQNIAEQKPVLDKLAADPPGTVRIRTDDLEQAAMLLEDYARDDAPDSSRRDFARVTASTFRAALENAS